MPKTPNILLLIGQAGVYDQGLLRGIAKYSRLHGQWSFHGNFGIPKEEISTKHEFQTDGVIARHLSDVPMSLKGVPIVVCKSIKEDMPGVNSIDVDSESVGKMAAEHFLGRGFKNFAYYGRDDKYWSRERQESFSSAVNDAGLDVSGYNETHREELWEKRQGELAAWIKSLPKPLALFACNDNGAQHVMQACRVSGLKVPDEVAILGVDNDELICNLSSPSISSVELNFERAGYESAELLDNLINGMETKRCDVIVAPLGIKPRQSTDILAIEDEDVSAALRFIRDNFDRAIGVIDILDHVALSRRSLELRFRKALGRSINSEIRRVRVEYACKLLSETNIPIKQIALNLGYTDTTHIARYFRIEKGMSLQAYRDAYGRK